MNLFNANNHEDNSGDQYNDVALEIIEQIEKGKVENHNFDGKSVFENSQQLIGNLSVLREQKKAALLRLFGKCVSFKAVTSAQEFSVCDWKSTKNNWIKYELKQARLNFHSASCLRENIKDDPVRLQAEFDRHVEEAKNRHLVFQYRPASEAESSYWNAIELKYVLKKAYKANRQRLVRLFDKLNAMLLYLYSDGCPINATFMSFELWWEEQKEVCYAVIA